MSGSPSGGILRVVRPADEPALMEMLDKRPERDAYIRGLIWRLGAVVPPEVGTVLAWTVDGRVEGVFLHGPVVVLACESPEGLAAFASRVGDYWYEQPITQLIAPRSMAEIVLAKLSDHFGALPPLHRLRHRMPAMTLRRGDLVSMEDMGLDPAAGLAPLMQGTDRQEELLADLARAVTLEDLGLDPLEFAAGSFMAALRHRIRTGREFLWLEDGRPMFRAALSAATPEAVLVEGVYVPPELRRTGRGKAGMYSLCDRLLRHHSAVVLLVGEDNEPARCLYERLGFVTFDDYQAAFFEGPPPRSPSRADVPPIP